MTGRLIRTTAAAMLGAILALPAAADRWPMPWLRPIAIPR